MQRDRSSVLLLIHASQDKGSLTISRVGTRILLGVCVAGFCCCSLFYRQEDYLESMQKDSSIELGRLDAQVREERDRSELMETEILSLEAEKARCFDAMQKLKGLSAYHQKRNADFADLRARHSESRVHKEVHTTCC